MKKADLIRALNIWAAPISRKLKILVRRGVLVRTTYKGNVRLLNIVLPGGTPLADIEHMEPFGYTSHAPDGAETIVISLGGDGSHTFVFMVKDQRYKIKIEKGESMLYNQFGDNVHVRKDRRIVVKSAVEVLFDAPKAKCLQDFEVVGKSKLNGHVEMPAGAKINDIEYITHKHPYTDNGIPLTSNTPVP